MTTFIIRITQVEVENQGTEGESHKKRRVCEARLRLDIPPPTSSSIEVLSADQAVVVPVWANVITSTLHLCNGEYSVNLTEQKEFSSSSFDKLVECFRAAGWEVDVSPST